MRRVAGIAWLGAGAVAASLAACQAIFPTDHFVAADAGDASSNVPPDASSDASSDAGGDQATCTPSLSDPRNCGRCGHDCRLGSCVDGGCGPFRMASFTSGSPGFVAVDTNSVYWGVYVFEGEGGVYMCPKTGCLDAGPTQLVYDDGIVGVAADGHNVYWAWNGDGTSTGAIRACALDAAPCDGGNATIVFTSAAAQGVAVDPAGTLVWTTNPATNAQQFPGSIYECTTGVCSSATPFATDEAGLEGVALTANETPYWVDRAGVVMTCVEQTCSSTTVVGSGGQPGDIAGLAVDDTSVYWANWGAEAGLYTCPLVGPCTNPTILLQGVPVYGIAVDDQAFYWTRQVTNSGPVELWSMVR